MTSDTEALPVQHGWRLLSDGLHIHRWFLHCHQAPDHHAYDGTDQPPTGPNLLLCGGPVAVLNEADCRLDADGRIEVPPEVLRTGRPAIGADVVEQVTRLVDRAELGYLCRLAVRTVVVSPDARGATPPTPAGWVLVAGSDSPVTFAEQLVVGAAVQWLRRFLADAPEARNGRRPGADAVAVAEHAIRIGAACRLLESLRTCPDLPPDQADLVERRHELHRAAAQQCREQVDETVGSLPLIAEDLVTTFFPWPRRFVKYEGGGGAGQSE